MCEYKFVQYICSSKIVKGKFAVVHIVQMACKTNKGIMLWDKIFYFINLFSKL